MTQNVPHMAFAEQLRKYVESQGSRLKRADLARAIGVSHRHLNNVLQGKRKLSPAAQARALATIQVQRAEPTTLRQWLKQEGMTVAELAQKIGRPRKTVEDWVYRDKSPSPQNRELLYSVTKLQEFRLDQADVPSARQEPPSERSPVPTKTSSQSGRIAVTSVSLLMLALEDLVTGPRTDRDWFRQRVPGSDIGYLRSALAALLDEERFEDWKRMTTYRPKLGGIHD